MNIVINSPKISAHKSLHSFVKEKAKKLAFFSDEIREIQIALKLRNTREPENKVCEIRALRPGYDLFAEKDAASFEEAAMKAIDAMKRQIADGKGKAACQ